MERSKKSLLMASCSVLNSYKLKSTTQRAFRAVKLSFLLVLSLGKFFPIQSYIELNLLSRNKSATKSIVQYLFRWFDSWHASQSFLEDRNLTQTQEHRDMKCWYCHLHKPVLMKKKIFLKHTANSLKYLQRNYGLRCIGRSNLKILPLHGAHMLYLHFRRVLSFTCRTGLLLCFWNVLEVNIASFVSFQEYDDGYGAAYDEQSYDSYDNSYSTQAQRWASKSTATAFEKFCGWPVNFILSFSISS